MKKFITYILNEWIDFIKTSLAAPVIGLVLLVLLNILVISLLTYKLNIILIILAIIFQIIILPVYRHLGKETDRRL